MDSDEESELSDIFEANKKKAREKKKQRPQLFLLKIEDDNRGVYVEWIEKFRKTEFKGDSLVDISGENFSKVAQKIKMTVETPTESARIDQ
jgi:hypothetical protein